LFLETHSPGGLAGSASRIENYLGFPAGISGNERRSSAQMLLAKATRLVCSRIPYVVELENGIRIPARAIIIATGARYRKLALENLSRFEGIAVYYGATFVEAQICSGEEVVVVGGGNAAGQAAVFLAESTQHVYMLLRSEGLADTMSGHLIRRIEETPAITLLPHTEIIALEGRIISSVLPGETVKPGKPKLRLVPPPAACAIKMQR
jgi:thioredoxin reductase (NADPH)